MMKQFISMVTSDGNVYFYGMATSDEAVCFHGNQ